MKIMETYNAPTPWYRGMARLLDTLGIRNLPGMVWLLTAAAVVKFFAYFIYPFAGLYVSRAFSASLVEVGWTLGANSVGMLIGFAAFGGLIDRFGSRAVLVFSSFALAAVSVLLSLAPTLTAFTVLFALHGFLGAGFRPSSQSLIAALCSDGDRPRAVSLSVMAWNSGNAAALALGGAIFIFNPSLLFLLEAVLNVAVALYLWVVCGSVKSATALKPTGTPSSRTPPAQAARMLRDSAFLIACATLFFVECVRAQTYSTLPVFLQQQYGFSPKQFGFLVSLTSFALVFISLPLTHGVRSIQRRYVVAVGAVLFCAAFFLYQFGRSSEYAALLALLSAAGQALLFPALLALVMARAKPELRGRYIGVYYAMASAAWSVAPLAGTKLYESLGPTALWTGCAIVGLAVVSLMLSRPLQPAPPA